MSSKMHIRTRWDDVCKAQCQALNKLYLLLLLLLFLLPLLLLLLLLCPFSRVRLCGPTLPLLLIKPPMGFPGGSDGKESTCSVEDPVSIPRLERSPEEGNGNPLRYSFLENLIDRRIWQATVHRVPKSQT